MQLFGFQNDWQRNPFGSHLGSSSAEILTLALLVRLVGGVRGGAWDLSATVSLTTSTSFHISLRSPVNPNSVSLLFFLGVALFLFFFFT